MEGCVEGRGKFFSLWLSELESTMGIEMNAGASFADEDVVELLSENMAETNFQTK